MEHDQKKSVVEFITKLLTDTDTKKQLIGSRGDYRQMAELTLTIWRVDPSRGFRFEKNTAVSIAIWGPAVLFPAQMYLLQDPLDNDSDYLQI